MDAFWQQMLRRFFRDPTRMSRNRNFHAFLDSHVRYASRIGGLLRSLRADLLGRPLVSISLTPGQPNNGETRHVLELLWSGGRRLSVLTAAELAILREDPHVDRVLRAAANGER